MRTTISAVLCSFIALVGFATTANAIATIDLVWSGTSDSGLSGVTSSDTITLDVIITNTPSSQVILGVAVSIEWDSSNLTFDSVQNNPEGTKGGPALALPSSIGSPSYNGSNQVNNINSAALSSGSGLAVGATHLLGRVTFHNGPGDGVTTITALFTDTDEILVPGVIGCLPICEPTFNSATVTNLVPEPAMASLHAIALVVLALARRRRS